MAASRWRASVLWMSGYRRLYCAVGAYALFMVALVLQANHYWLNALAPGPRQFVAENNLQGDANSARTPVTFEDVEVVSIGINGCGYAIQVGHLDERHWVVTTRCLPCVWHTRA